MSSYYYLMAQLPFLTYEQKPPMSSSAFKALAGYFLTKGDAAFLPYLSIVPDNIIVTESAPSTGCVFIDEWKEWGRVFALNLAKQRAVKVHRENAASFEPPSCPHDAAVAAVKAVTGEATPLEAEIQIDKTRWNTIDSLTGLNYFDRNHVYAYFLKLLLLERRQAFNVDIGFSEYKSLYADIIESAHKSLGEPK